MTYLEITNENSASVVLDFVYEPNPFTPNTWSTVSGDTGVLGVDQGHWTADGLQNRLIVRDASDAEIAVLEINLAVSLTDPFQNVLPGDSGDGVLTNGGLLTWARDCSCVCIDIDGNKIPYGKKKDRAACREYCRQQLGDRFSDSFCN
jgi:hypothetical protein